MKVKVIKIGVTYESSILDIGAVIDVSEADGARLIEAGYVEPIEDPAEESTEATTEDPDEVADQAPKKTPRKRTK